MIKFYTSKKFIITALTAAVILAGGAGAWSAQANHQTEVKKEAASTAPAKSAAVQQKTSYSYKGVEGKTALELLKAQQKVTVKTYSFGDQVIGINGLEGNGPKYWTFYLNGKMADVGAGAYSTKAGDTIEWKLEQQ